VKERDTIMRFFLFFLVLTLMGGSSFIHYNYGMDDALTWNFYYVNQSFGINSISEMIDKAFWVLEHHYNDMQRFLGVMPFVRSVEINLSTDVRYVYFLNLLSHAITSFFLYWVLLKTFKCQKLIALSLASVFALALNINIGTQALVLLNGSMGVNLLTLFFLVWFLETNKENFKKYIIVIIYSVYAVVAIGEYVIVIFTPALAILYYLENRNFVNAAKYFVLINIPIAINLFVRSFAPESSYVGTILNLDPVHVLSNIYTILMSLIGSGGPYGLAILIGLSCLSVYGLIRKDIDIYHFICVLSLMMGMVVLYSIGSRVIFNNHYFFYIPYAGFIMLLAITLSPIAKRNILLRVAALVFIGVMGGAQYHFSEAYRAMRSISASAVNQDMNDFKKVEELTFSNEKKVVIIVRDHGRNSLTPLATYNKTYNIWKRKSNQVIYIISSANGIKLSKGKLWFRTSYSQYNPKEDKLLLLTDLLKKHNVSLQNCLIARVSNGLVKLSKPNDLKKIGLYYDYDVVEPYGDTGRYFFWTSGDFSMHAFHAAAMVGKKALLTFTVTSLFDDKISFSYPGHHELITLKAGVPYPYSRMITINGEEMKFSLKSKKAKVPPGDSRSLSFRLDDDISYKLLEGVTLNFSHEYGLETDHSSGKNFFWTSGDFSMHAFNAASVVGKKTLLSFTVTSLFDDNISFSYPGHHELITVKAGVPYLFSRVITIDGEDMTFSLKSNKAKVPSGDSRLLSFRLDDHITYELAKLQ